CSICSHLLQSLERQIFRYGGSTSQLSGTTLVQLQQIHHGPLQRLLLYLNYNPGRLGNVLLYYNLYWSTQVLKL
uniref:Uncharacterized protein n=1 Tax=Aegilops tauschii subsp. strangulata TaxID=200361 RepID=A0A453RPY1_AEGTS